MKTKIAFDIIFVVENGKIYIKYLWVELVMNYDIDINGLPVKAVYTDESINEIFIPLLKKLTNLQKEKGRRILVMLAAPPGAGKSTLSSFLRYLSNMTEGVNPISVIGMDGFHRYQDYLLNHTIIRDGVETLMVNVKGTPETFDLPLFIERVKKVVEGEECGWPEYDRLKHNPQEDAITVAGDIVLLEGNYLLLEDEGWNELRSYADYSIKIVAQEDNLRKRLIDRKIMSGSDIDTAVQFVDYSDMYNVRICLNRSSEADLTLKLNMDNSYSVMNGD